MFDFLKISDKKEPRIDEKKSKFEIAQQNIEELSLTAQEHKRAERVAERGMIFAHKVTGKELNTALEHIDNAMIQTKKVQIEILRHINQLYQALDSLDEEHLAGILTALKAAETATDSARVNDENIGKITDYLLDDDRLLVLKQEQDLKIEALTNKLKIAYLVAGSGLVVAVVSVLICLMNLL